MTVKLVGSSSGSVSLQAPASTSGGANRVLTLPDADATLLSTASSVGKILQVKQTVKTNTTSINSATYADISGFTVTITPSSASNKILISFVLQFGGTNNSYVAFKAYRGSTLLPIGTEGTGNMTNASFGGYQEQNNSQFGVSTAVWQYLDSPSSTSALTYKLQWSSVYQPGGTYQFYLNRPYNADNNAYNIFGVSTITAMEVAA